MSYASSILLPNKEFLNEFKESTEGKEKNLASISFIGTHSNDVSEKDIKEVDDELFEAIELSGIKNIKPKSNKNYKYLVPLDSEVQGKVPGKESTFADTNNFQFTDPSKICDYIHEWLKKQDNILFLFNGCYLTLRYVKFALKRIVVL